VTDRNQYRRASATALRAAKAFTRRNVLQHAAAAGAVAATGPLIVRGALASSGELRLLAREGYVHPRMIEDFAAKTGVRLDLATYLTSTELASELRASSGGYDLVILPVADTPRYVAEGLLAELEERRINVHGIVPTIWRSSAELGGAQGGRRYCVPFNWGSEVLAFDRQSVPLAYGDAAYGSLWEEGVKGRVTARPESLLIGIGLHLDATGQVPSNRLLDTYRDEESLRRVYDRLLAFFAEHRDWIGRYWTNPAEAEAVFAEHGCVLGQLSDAAAMRLKAEGFGQYTYVAAREGAIAWLDGMAIPRKAGSVEQAYAWINWCYTPEAAGLHVEYAGYNSVTVGAEMAADGVYARNFAAAYPDDALANLWWWPAEDAALAAIRKEYLDRALAL
jgi:spermidine/putrescine transport system substrate-binding protein